MAPKRFNLYQAREDFLQKTNTFHRDDTFCDLTIQCGNTTMKAHRMVLAAHSDWFLKACAGHFKEAQSQTITLEEDDESDVKSMINFCYNFTYEEDAEDPAPMTKAVDLFTLGDKYLIPTLQTYAADRFAHHSTQNYHENDFFPAIKAIYTSTSDPQRLLRNTVVEVLQKRYAFASLWTSDFNELLDSTPGLAADAFRAVAKANHDTATAIAARQAQPYRERRKKYRCPAPNCDATFEAFIRETEMHVRTCNRVGTTYRMTGKEWEQYDTSTF